MIAARHGAFDVLLPLAIFASGSLLNTKFTERIPLIVAWLGGFLLQAVLRSLLNGTPVAAALAPMTGLAFVLFTFYMVTDPGATPSRRRAQVAFGGSVAVAYGVLVALHVVFVLFFLVDYSYYPAGRRNVCDGLVRHCSARAQSVGRNCSAREDDVTEAVAIV